MKTYACLLSFLMPILVACSPVHITDLRCDYQEDPLALDNPDPEFGWRWTIDSRTPRGRGPHSARAPRSHSIADGAATQSAYAIEVRDAAGNPVWQSGRVESSDSQHIPYAGEALLPLHDYRWRVQVWDARGKALRPSSWSRFRTAPEAGWLDASWIGAITRADSHLPEGRNYEGGTVGRDPVKKAAWEAADPLSRQSILLRREFRTTRKIAAAYAYISGLGHYELSLNGQKLGADQEFAPLWSDYDKTVYYNVFDVTSLLRSENAVGVLLGNGFYNVQGGRYRKLLVSFGPPTLLFRLHVEYTDGSSEDIRSDASWRYAPSPVIYNDIYGGEDYDARLEQPGWDRPGFDDGAWLPVVVQEPPRGILRPQSAPPVRIRERYSVRDRWDRIQPAAPKQRIPEDVKVIVLDMGQNLAGFPEIRIRGAAGKTVRLTVGEALSADSLVSQSQSGGPHFYEYTLRGGTRQWHPRFSYYGFRYIQVQGAVLKGDPNPEGLPVIEDIRSCFVYNSAPVTGSFSSSNTLFTDIHRLIQMAVRSNMQSVFTDCPHREKLGWLEQLQLNGEGLLYNYDLTTLWPKLLQDMRDAQLPDGMVPTTAPTYVDFGGGGIWDNSPEWGSSAVILPFLYFNRYGDDRLIRSCYPMMKAYIEFLERTSDGHITTVGLGDWYDFGAQRSGFAQNTPVPLVGTAHHYQNIRLAQRAAAILGLPDDEAYYSRLGDEVLAAFNEKYFDARNVVYGTGSQASYAIPLAMGMVAPEHRETAMQHLLDDIRAHGNRLSTGEVGNCYMFELLARNGYNALMYEMHNHQEVPGYGYQLKFGATTLTEQWDPREGASWNHFMLGAIDEWFFHSLGGIQVDPERPGGRHLIIRPEAVGDLEWVECGTETLYGSVRVRWRRQAGRFALTVTLPGNTSADVWLPGESQPLPMGPGTRTFVKQ